MDKWHKSLWACVHARGGHFEHLVGFKITHMLMFTNNVLNTSIIFLLLIFVFHKVV